VLFRSVGQAEDKPRAQRLERAVQVIQHRSFHVAGRARRNLAEGRLEVMKTPNQDSPLSVGKKPLLAIDVWEHAYYLKYQNRRPEYIEAFYSVINWNAVNNFYVSAKR
jgi:superoxide dismutase